MLNVIGLLIIGALIGWIASLIMGTDDQMGAGANIIVGIVGAVIGSFIGSVLNINAGTFSIGGIILGVIGAVILIAIVNAIRR